MTDEQFRMLLAQVQRMQDEQSELKRDLLALIVRVEALERQSIGRLL